MSRENTLYQLSEWAKTVTQNMDHLSKAQAKVLAMISFAMVLTRRCGLTTIAVTLAQLLHKKEKSVTQMVYEWYCDAPDKKGYDEARQMNRAQLEVTTCFTPLLRWVLSLWQSSYLPLVLDATALGDRLVVLAVSVTYRGCAIPVAWKILVANQPHAWEPEWERLLTLLKPAVPETMTVFVMGDRGVYSPSLFTYIQSLHWHPSLRINAGGKFRPQGDLLAHPLSSFVPRPGTYWCGQGTAFKMQLPCTLLAFWEQHADEPWLIVTDLSPDQVQACLYSLRAWIEQGFRTIKRGGLQWHNTKITDPSRAARLWLAIALAMLWLISVGTPVDDVSFDTVNPLEPLTPSSIPVAQTLYQQRPIPPPPKRRLSVFLRGWITTLITLLDDGAIRLQNLIPSPFPCISDVFTPTS